MNTDTGQIKTRSYLLEFLLAAVAFGCTMGFARTYSSGFTGAIFAGTASQIELVEMICSNSRMVVLVALTVVGCLHKIPVNRLTLVTSGVCMGIGSLVLSVSAIPVLQVAMAIVCGAGSAFAMFGLMLFLSSKSLKEIVVASILGLAIGGLDIGGLMALTAPASVALLIVSGVLSTLCLVLADPQLECCVEQGTITVGELRMFPWFSAITFIVCGVLGALIYGVATTLSWGVMEGVSYPVMGIAALVIVAACSWMILKLDNWTQVIWVPMFALLAVALALVITSGQMLGAVALGFVFALIMCYHFLRWMVIPALVSTSLLPRFLTSGILLVITNSIFNVGLGEKLATVLPLGMQDPSTLGGVIALTVAVVFAFATFVDRAGREAMDEEKLLAPMPVEQSEASAAESIAEEAPETPADEEPPAEEKTIEDRCAELGAEFSLTPREEEICVMTARGYSSTYIAEQLYISSSTVRFHQQNLYRKLDVHSKQELINFVESGL